MCIRDSPTARRVEDVGSNRLVDLTMTHPAAQHGGHAAPTGEAPQVRRVTPTGHRLGRAVVAGHLEGERAVRESGSPATHQGLGLGVTTAQECLPDVRIRAEEHRECRLVRFALVRDVRGHPVETRGGRAALTAQMLSLIHI